MSPGTIQQVSTGNYRLAGAAGELAQHSSHEEWFRATRNTEVAGWKGRRIMYSQERHIRDRFSRYACVKCGACHTGDDVIVLARRASAWLIMLTCTQCQRRGVFVVSAPQKRRARVCNETANNAPLADGTAGATWQPTPIGQSAAPDTDQPGQRTPPDQPDQLVALDQITPLDQLEQLEHTHYLDTQSSWAELWPEPLIDRLSLSIPSCAAENADADMPDSPNAPNSPHGANTSSLPTLPPPTNPQQPQPEWFTQSADATHPPFASSSSPASSLHSSHAARQVTHADVAAIRSFLRQFNGDFQGLFGGANPGEQV